MKIITFCLAVFAIFLTPLSEAKSPCRLVINMSYDGGVDMIDLERSSYEYLKGWTGQCKGDVADGYGVWDGLDMKDGTIRYEGWVKNGMPDGEGTLIKRTYKSPVRDGTDHYVIRSGRWEKGRFVYGTMNIPNTGFKNDYKFDGEMNGWNPKYGVVSDIDGRVVYKGDIEVMVGGALYFSESHYLELLQKEKESNNRKIIQSERNGSSQAAAAGGALLGAAAASVIAGAVFVGVGVALVRGAVARTIILVLIPK